MFVLQSNRLSLNDSNQMDTVSENRLRFPKMQNLIGSIYRSRRKSRSNSVNLSTDAIPETIHIENVMLFLDNLNGKLVNISSTMKTIHVKSSLGPVDGLPNAPVSPPPFFPINKNKPILTESLFQHNLDNLDIDLINVGAVNVERSNDRHTVYLFCRNFKLYKLILSHSMNANHFIDRINAMYQINVHFASPPSPSSKQLVFESTPKQHQVTSALWNYLYHNYHYNKPTDWLHNEPWFSYLEKHSRKAVKHTLFNEIKSIESLPETFLVPFTVPDTKLSLWQTYTNLSRVPVVTYYDQSTKHMLLRSSQFHKVSCKELLFSHVNPLRQVNVDNMLPPLLSVELCYEKLRKHCYELNKQSNEMDRSAFYDINKYRKFLSKSGPWMNCVSSVLRFAISLVQVIKQESSIVLIESTDTNWNCVVSCLVQVIIDPHRKTVQGFESLISKEWIYLTGNKARVDMLNQTKVTTPNVTLFHLFLDCVHQLIVQNYRAFEFTTLYLVTLVDFQFVIDNYRRDKSLQLEANKHHILMWNPFYSGPSSDGIEISLNVHISQLKLFKELFFRHIRSIAGKYCDEESIFLDELSRRMII